MLMIPRIYKKLVVSRILGVQCREILVQVSLKNVILEDLYQGIALSPHYLAARWI